jgi:hypothetical protein
VKLDSSIKILLQSVNLLRNTGFFRGFTNSCVWLSKAMYKKWEQTKNIVYLADAYNNMTLGFVSTSQSLGLTSKL